MFKKGYIPWNKGIEMPEDWRIKQKQAMQGVVNSGQFKKGCISKTKGMTGLPCYNGLKGKKMPEAWKLALRKPKSITHPCTPEKAKKIGDAQRGDKHWNWKGGVRPESEIIRQSREYYWWRKSVFERDEYTCQVCNDKTGGNLQAHHIKPFSTNPELHYAIDNGQTLCISCHRKTDNYGGRQTFREIRLQKQNG